MAEGVVSELAVLFKADTSALEKGLSRARQDIKDTGAAAEKGGGLIGGLVGGLGKLGLAGLGIGAIKGAVSGVVGSFGDLIGAAEAAGDAKARLDGVLGSDLSGVIQDNATIANQLGLTKTAYLEAAGSAADYLTNLGLGKDAVADMAMGMTELAPKLAAFKNVDPEAMTNALQRGLTGSTGALEKMGFAIDQNLLKGMDDAAKAQAIYAQVVEQSGPASAAWADNQTDVAHSMARVSAAMDDAKAAIGERLLPIIAPLVQWFADKLPGAIDMAAKALGPVLTILSDLGSLISGTIGPVFAGFADGIETAADDAMGPFSAAVSGISSALEAMGFEKVAAFVHSFAAAMSQAWEVITGTKDAVSSYNPMVQKLGDIMVDVAGGAMAFRDHLLDAWGKIKDAVGRVVDWFNASVKPLLLGVFEAVAGKVNQLRIEFEEKFGSIRGFVQSIIDWFNTHVAPTIAVVFDRIAEKLVPLVQFFRDHLGEVQLVVMGVFDVIVGVIRTAFALIKGTVETALAVFRGDWSGAWNAIKNTAESVLPAISRIFAGIGDILRGIGKMALDAMIGVGENMIAGLKQGARDAWGKFLGWFDGIIALLPATVKRILGIKSPSTVFAGIGENIVAGLRIGLEGIAIIGAIIQDGLAKAIGSMDVENFEMIHRLTTAILGIFKDAADGIRSLLEFDIVTSADEIGAAFDRLIGVFQTAIGKMAELSKFAGRGTQPGQEGFINMDHIANIERYTGAIEATLGVASGTLDILDKLAKVAMPGAGAITALIPFLQEIANAAAVFEQPLGKDEDAIAVFERGAVVAGHIATFAKNVADLTSIKFGAISAKFADEVRAAAAAAGLAWEAVKVVAEFWGDKLSMERDKLIVGVKAYAEVIGAAVSILKGAGELDFTKASFATAVQLGKAADVAKMAAGELFRIAEWWTKEAPEKWERILEGMKLYADAAGAAVSILGAAGGLDLSKMVKVTFDQLTHAADTSEMAAGELFRIAEWWTKGPREHWTRILEGMKDYADAAGAAIGILGAAGALDLSKAVKVTADQIEAAANLSRDALAAIRALAKEYIEMGAEAAGPLVAGVKAFADGAGAAIDLLVKGAGGINALGEIKSLAGVQPGLIRAVLGNLKLALDTVLANLPTFKPEQLARLKDMGDMAGVFDPLAKAATGINALGAIKSLAGVQPRLIRAILGGVNLAVKEVSAGAGTFEDGAVAKVKAWGEASAATLGALTTAADGLTKLGGKITIPEDLSARVAMLVSAMRTVVQGMAAALSGDGAISVDVAKAGADIAEAVGRIGEAFAPIFDAINAALASPFGRIKAKGQRGDTFRQNIADRIKASLVAAVTALSEALASMPAIEVPDTLLTGVERLATVYDRILDILGKLDGIKIDAKALTALAAVPGILAGGLTGMNVQGSGGTLTMSGGASGGGITINNTVTPTFVPMPVTINNTVTAPITVGPRVVQAIAVEVVNQFDTEIKLKPSGP